MGEPERVRDDVARYRELLGITHLVIRTQVPGVEEGETLAALDHLAELAEG